jgi:hypothetical protein
MRLRVVVLCLVGWSTPSLAGENFFFGTWGAGGEAGTSILGGLEITATTISWDGSRSSPKCRTTLTLGPRLIRTPSMSSIPLEIEGT